MRPTRTPKESEKRPNTSKPFRPSAACGAAGGLQAHLLTLHGMVRGPASSEVVRRLGEEGGYAVPPS
eukprot:9476933-Pyramimonas_sp.AAC.1